MKTEIRNDPGMSSYFAGDYRGYGRYQWNVKYPRFQSDQEIEAARFWALGEYVKNSDGNYGFSVLSDMLKRPIESSMAGRSGGWLVIDTPLTAAELRKIDRHVAQSMQALPGYLKEEREFRRQEAEDAVNAERRTRAELAADKRVERIKALVREVAGTDAVLMLKGIKII